MRHITSESRLHDIPPTDAVIDAIAEIEAQRQAIEQEAGTAAASSGALRRLHELLDSERQLLQSRGPETRHPVNIDAVTTEIARMKGRARSADAGSSGKGARPEKGVRPEKRTGPGPRQVSLRSETRNPPRNKGRRTMGRAGGR
jgi:hypothetical protein